MLRLAAPFDRRTTSDKARRVLDRTPRPNAEVINATADSLQWRRPTDAC